MSCCEAVLAALRYPFTSAVNFPAVIGLLTLAYSTVSLSKFAWMSFRCFILARYFPSFFGIDLKRFGSWAVITGPTAGIGREYAIQLARDHGLNLLLIGRSIDRLKSLVETIESCAPGIKTKYVAIDFAAGFEIYDKIEAELDGLDIAVLVNNVGDVGDINDFNFFYETRRSTNFWDVIHTNCSSTTFMTQMVLHRMKAKGKGVIINLSSAAGQAGMPFGAVYAATKAYIATFSRTLQIECYGSGIIIQTLYPIGISTKMTRRPPSLTVYDVETFVRSAISTLGMQNETSGTFVHDIISAFNTRAIDLMPLSVFRPIAMSYADDIIQCRHDEISRLKKD